MRETLAHSPVRLTGEQAKIVGQSLQGVAYNIHALAVSTIMFMSFWGGWSVTSGSRSAP